MGEYYNWVNINKKEYIAPCDFGLGSKLWEAVVADNQLLGALYDLLSSDWKGDMIVFLGDETNITENEKNPVLRKLHSERKEWSEPGYDADYVTENYKCISGLFKAAEETICTENPDECLLARDSHFFRYTINHSKQEFFDLEKTQLICPNKWEAPKGRINPLPLLMAFSDSSNDKCTGLWIGDQIDVSDEAPPVNYRDMSAYYGWD